MIDMARETRKLVAAELKDLLAENERLKASNAELLQALKNILVLAANYVDDGKDIVGSEYYEAGVRRIEAAELAMNRAAAIAPPVNPNARLP